MTAFEKVVKTALANFWVNFSTFYSDKLVTLSQAIPRGGGRASSATKGKKVLCFWSQESVPKFLTIEVLSSKSKASVTVDGTTVSWNVSTIKIF